MRYCGTERPLGKEREEEPALVSHQGGAVGFLVDLEWWLLIPRLYLSSEPVHRVLKQHCW